MTREKKALIVVDMQNDFCPGGALSVDIGDIMPRLNILIKYAEMSNWVIVASMDWHPAQTTHFEKWPPHCIAGTKGADLYSELEFPSSTIILKKGMSDKDDGYSAFEGSVYITERTDLKSYLYSKGVADVYVAGLALDYCVKATAHDAWANYFRTHLVLDVTRSVSNDNAIPTILGMIDSRIEITTTRQVCRD